MKRFTAGFAAPAKLAILSLALFSILAATGCNDYGNTFQNPTGAFISTLSPSNVSAGGPEFTINITGQGFVAKTLVQWNGKNLATTVAMDSSGNVLGNAISAVVPAALIANAGTAFVNTISPASGAGQNGLSNTLSFIVNPAGSPLPSLSTLTPNSAAAGAATFTLTLAGSNFLPTTDPSGGSKVNWNFGGTQTTLPIVSISASQIQATVSSTLLVNATTANVTANVSVFNPPAPSTTTNPTGGGGGSSAALPFTITPAGAMSHSASQTVSEETPAVSTDGRYVAYAASAGDHSEVFVRDTCENAPKDCQPSTRLISATFDGSPANDDSRSPSMSADGRFIAFSSAATNLLAADSAASGRQIYLRDTCAGVATDSCKPETHLVSQDSAGALVGTESILPSVSASGRFVAFLAVTPSHNAKNSAQASQSKIATTPNSGLRQVFVRDTCLGASACTPKTTRISLQPGDGISESAKPAGPALSGGSNHVALSGAASATVFTRSLPVDDRIFLALTGNR